MAARATAVLLILIGVALLGGGGWLIALGGSWYYALAGVGLLVVAGLLLAGRSAAVGVYALLLLGSLAWAVWEVGFDWWQLAPRGWLFVVLGVWLLTPWVTRSLAVPGERMPGPWRGAGAALTASVLAAAAVAGYAMLGPSDTLAGRLPTEPVTPVPADYAGVPEGEWHAYGRSGFGDRYSPLDQITTRNVANLQVAWEYRTGDVRRPTDPNETTYQVTPLVVGDLLYLCTPHNYVIALDAATGVQEWRFDPEVPDESNRQHLTCRGVSYHAESGAAADAPCGRRIFMPTADARLIALDAATGARCEGFGQNGQIDLWDGMPHKTPGYYYSTSPPVVTRDLVVIGGAVNDNVSTTEPSGVIRAYDVRTGALVWNWDAGAPERTEPIPADALYAPNTPNAWAPLAADEGLGLVYAPLGNAPPDQWGGNRTPEMERFSSSVVALDLATGALRWTFQTVHHDLWDMDVPAQPSLLDLTIDGRTVPALVQPTKQGDVYVLDRRTGEPLLPVEEVPAPQGAAAGDWTAPTQPVSALSFQPPDLRGSDMWGVSPFDQLVCRIRFRQLRYEGRYTPPGVGGTLVHPGNFGVFNWGGVAVDPVRQVLFGTPSYMAFVSELVPRDDPQARYVTDAGVPLNENFGAPFAVRLGPFLSPLGLPCQAPPWGYVAGADLRTGRIAWMHPNGTVRDRAPVPLPFAVGVPDLGGPLLTAGGLAFMSGSIDYYVRAFDVTTGAKLWEERLPAGGQATPMSYRTADGRQFVVVVAGGHGSLGTKAGDHVIAYALPPG